MLKVSLFASSIMLTCFSVVKGMSTEALGYRTSKRLDSFGSVSTKTWKNDGVAGRYNLCDTSSVLFRFNEAFDIESLLGYCRCHFIYSVRLDSTFQLTELNISGNVMKAFYERNVKKIEADIKLSEKQAKKLAFVTCFDVGWKECMKILDSVLGNNDRKILSMGLSHEYSLEEAYIILHMHPSFRFWDHISQEKWDTYVNMVAGALNTVTNDGKAISLKEPFNRQTVLKSVVEKYFNKFLLNKDVSQ